MNSDPHRDLAQALRSANNGTSRATISTRRIARRPWASAGLVGVRHKVCLHFQGVAANTAAAAFIDGLAEREFVLPGHIVADIAVVDLREDGEDRLCLTLEALTVEGD